jgi:hypothetical protein
MDRSSGLSNLGMHVTIGGGLKPALLKNKDCKVLKSVLKALEIGT